MVDTTFINNTSIDAICVLSAYSILLWSANRLMDLGTYAYRVNRDNMGVCLCLTFIGCSVLSVVLLTLHKPIARLYSLTEVQYSMLENAITILGIFCFIKAVGEFGFEYLLLNGKNRLAIITNVVFYICMFAFDGIVFCSTKKFEHYLIGTAVSYLIYDIVIIANSDFLKGLKKPELKLFKQYGKQSLDILCDQLVGKIATLVYNIYASKLGTELYAIHSVCYAVCTFNENYSDPYSLFCISTLSGYDSDKRFSKTKKLMRKYGWVALVGTIITAYPLLLFIHGDVSISVCIPYTIIYSLDIFFLVSYQCLRGYLTVEGKTKVLRYGGFIGVLTRIPVMMILYYSGCGLFSFAIPCTVDFGVRSLYYLVQSKRYRKG